MIEPREVLQKCQKKEIDQAELYYTEKNQKEIEIEGTEIKYTKENQIEGIGIRVIKQNKIGFSSTSNNQKINQTIEQAIKNSEINQLELPGFTEEQKYPKVNQLYDKKTASYSMKELIRDANEVIQTTNQDNVKPTTASINQTKTKTRILNSQNVDQMSKKTTITAAVEALARSGKNTATAFNHESKTSIDQINYKEIAKEARDTAKESLGTKERVQGEKNVVLEPFAASSILKSTLIPSLSAEEIQKNRSRIPEFQDKKIAPSFLEIKDDGTLNNAVASRKFDDEATPTAEREIISEGKLKGIYHNLKTAERANEESTGNAKRTSYTNTPTIGPNNFIIKPDEDKNEFIKENDLLIRSVLGAHTANKLTGDFSLGIKNGYKIKNGKKIPIKQAMVSGNIYKLLQDLKAIGKEKREIGGIITPPIKTKLTISG